MIVSRFFRMAVCLSCLLLVLGELRSQEIDFNESIKPIFRERCFACHGALKQESSLRLDSATHLLAGGDSGDAVDAKEPEESELLRRIRSGDEAERMPPEGKPLTAAEISEIQNWIRQGAKIPASDQAESDPRQHWAFIAPARKAIALSFDKSASAVSTNPIDSLLSSNRISNKIRPVGPAPPGLLIRRVYLDLIGVPPSLEQQNEFLRDPSQKNYRQIVDRLLNQPQFGERWGRHFMDVWRYSDWYGLGKQLRYSQKHLWHWRDWIIESFNEDKPYDRMIHEMLAGDEIAPTDSQTLRATGFLARNYYLFNRTTWLDSTIEHTSKAFLGLTTNCSKCHDHKYDPISHEDYYRLRAVFEPHQVRLDPLPGETDLEANGLPRVFDAHPELKTFLHERGDEKSPDESNPLSPGAFSFFQFGSLDPQAIELPVEAANPALQDFVLKDRVALLEIEKKRIEAKLQNALANLKQLPPDSKPARTEKKSTPFESYVFANDSKNEPAVLLDSFDALDSSIWKVRLGKWKIEKGRLVQTETGAVNHTVESTVQHPPDFLLETTLQVRGGQMWKSIGIKFDVQDNHDKTVYLSAHSTGKVQVSFQDNGKTTYPENGRALLPVVVNQDYRLRIAVDGNAIAIAVDGKPLVRYSIPGKRRPGKIALMSFDSVAAFDQIQVIPLPDSVQLEAAAKMSQRESAELRVKLHQAGLNRIALDLQRLHSAFAADRSKASGAADPELIRNAATAQRQFDLAQAEESLLDLQWKGITDQGVAAQVTAAKAKVAQLRKAVQDPGTSYTSIRASKKALEGPAETSKSQNQPYPKTSTGRRLAFAKWITHRKNPLTARVIVNHVWMRHFGQPLVDPVTDFGRRTPRPPQHELLDFLAVDLMENEWRLKRLHRLIVTSNAYQMASQVPKSLQHQLETDAVNEFYWRRLPGRMESQVIRDSLLSLSGQLIEQLGGPPLDPNSQSKRRSLYFRQSRDHQNRFVGMFDDADILRCYRRQESIIPQQSLAMANSKLVYSTAELIADRLNTQPLSDSEFIKKAFRLILSRECQTNEIQICQEALEEFRKLAPASNTKKSIPRERVLMLMSLLNHNDFLSIR